MNPSSPSVEGTGKRPLSGPLCPLPGPPHLHLEEQTSRRMRWHQPKETTLASVSLSGSQLSLSAEALVAALGASWVFLTCAPPSLAQVKVWFQNRRTKYKRQKLEEEGPESEQKKKGSHHINRWRIATKQANGEDIDVTSND